MISPVSQCIEEGNAEGNAEGVGDRVAGLGLRGVDSDLAKPKRFAAHPPPTDRLKRKKNFHINTGLLILER